MLANGRPEMVRRAVNAFHAQTYGEKMLLIWNTGGREDFDELEHDDVAVVYSPDPGSIGTLRNRANGCAVDLFKSEAEVLAHWDSDDWSHPRRLSEQMELLENTRADLIGYREGLFWDTYGFDTGLVSQAAWTYRNANPKGPFGSSFLYPAETWKRVPFPPQHVGEDTLWLLRGSGKVKIHAVPSTWDFRGLPNFEPRMICQIHGGNTASAIQPGKPEWKREPIYDAYCHERMKL